MSSSAKGFFLIDGLINVAISIAITILCIAIFTTIKTYASSYINYSINDEQFYLELFNSYSTCEKCIVYESD